MLVVHETAISSLINTRAQALGISRVELVTRCGFKNIAKGLRRLNEVCAGDFSSADFLLCRLPDALSLEPYIAEAAALATRQSIERKQEQSYRDTFRPHAIIICERSIPQPIWLASVLGMDRILRIDFKEGSAPVTYVQQALDGLDAELRDWRSSALPAFGCAHSVVVNYAYDNAVEFNLAGQPLRVFDNAVRLGLSTLALSGRSVTPAELDCLFSS